MAVLADARYLEGMARATIELVQALRATAVRLEGGAHFKWSHFGVCNCGHLAQTVTRLPPEVIQEAAFERAGDWGDQALEFCPLSGLPMDHIIGALLELGLDREDLRRLERLSDGDVLRRLPPERRALRKTVRDDAIAYMRAWADLLEDALPEGERDRLHALPAAA